MKFQAILVLLNEICSGRAYLVGGSVRDLLLGREPRDMDIVVADKAEDVVGRLAEVARIKPVVLDAKHDIMRVVLSDGHLDISGMGNNRLENDLKRRDFTINAIALPVSEYLKGGNLSCRIIDPLGGLGDLRQGIIRACSPRVFEDDPVRIFRALRLQSQLGFTIAESTVQLMRNSQNPLAAAPGERIWEELGYILELSGSSNVFRFLEQETGVLEQLFPEIKSMRQVEQNHYHGDNLWEHSIKTLACFEEFLTENNLPSQLRKNLWEYLLHPVRTGRKRIAVIKLACLFHDLGKLKTRGVREDGRITFYGHHKVGSLLVEKIACRLRMSGKETRLLRLLVKWHMQPLFLYIENPPTKRAVIRFFRHLGEDTPGCLLLSLADVTSSRISIGRKDLAQAYITYISDLLNRFFREKARILYPEPLLNGKDIASLLNLEPSPLVGKLKNALIDAQVEGKVTTRSEAENFMRRIDLKQLR